MIETIKQLGILISKTDKLWLIPITLFLVIVALIIVSAHLAPVPIFLYPFI